jgi:hypothetical protein
MSTMVYDIIKNNFSSKYRPDLRDNFISLLQGLESMT